MSTIKSFSDMRSAVSSRGERKVMAVVWPADENTRQAVADALAEGIVDAVMVGCRQQVEADASIMAHAGHVTIVDAPDADSAAAAAVELVRSGYAHILMKGMLNTDNLLRAVLNKEHGILPLGNVLTHLTASEIPALGRLLIFTDAAVIPYPNDAQRHAQVTYVLSLARRLGIDEPKVALVHCSEKVDERHFPFTADYVRLREMAQAGELGQCVVDGPLDVKTSLSLAAMQKKGIASAIAGAADALVFPDIESANTFYKTITLLCGASTAGLIVGASAPVVLPSRGDSAQSKLCSIALAAL